MDAAAARSHPQPALLVETYRKARPQAPDGELRSAIMGDALFGAGSRRLADAHAGSAAATYRYSFSWRSNALGGELGATHAVELPFVFDVTHLPRLRGPQALLDPDEPPSDLAARMHAAWVAFATAGHPGWDRYDTRRRATMCIGDDWSVVDNPRGEELQAWP
ncbi:carboxylesterase family protein [Nonomuraea sp. B5E05]|uniref:carboxylesterase family protein n=1 Tax=Nonomuraea sp. B5E05 TaxID=3153569 RepID=UPI00326169DF